MHRLLAKTMLYYRRDLKQLRTSSPKIQRADSTLKLHVFNIAAHSMKDMGVRNRSGPFCVT